MNAHVLHTGRIRSMSKVYYVAKKKHSYLAVSLVDHTWPLKIIIAFTFSTLFSIEMC